MVADTFETVTELAGAEISTEQLQRAINRYSWAARQCKGKDVLELACGAGMGLGLLLDAGKSVTAGDYTESIVGIARAHYGERLPLLCMNAESLPFIGNSFDRVLLVEAIYYLSNLDDFLNEVKRVLRPNGQLLIVSANKDIFDFNPSPFSHKYLGVVEFTQLLSDRGFLAEFYGDVKIIEVSLRQRILRPIKWLAIRFNLVPKTMKGKKFLKRLVFGSMTTLPTELRDDSHYQAVTPDYLSSLEPCRDYKTLFIKAALRE